MATKKHVKKKSNPSKTIKDNYKYIVMYGYPESKELYGIADSISQAESFIKDCIHENDVSFGNIYCYESLETYFNVKTVVSIE